MSHTNSLLESPIIFIGPGRSGSTIVSEIVFAHERLAWPTNHQEYLPSALWVNLLRPPFDNSHWRILGEKGQINRTRVLNSLLPYPSEAYPFWESITRDDINFSRGFLLEQTANKEERKNIHARLSCLTRLQGKQRFAMKITGPGRIGYLKSIFPNARFVNVIRDPVATVHSLLEVTFWKEQGMTKLWWKGAYSEQEIETFETLKHDPIAATAFQLAKILDTTKEEAIKTNAMMLTVHYEDFVANPKDTIQDILYFAKLPNSIWVQRKLNKTAIHNQNSRTRKYKSTDAESILSFMHSHA